MTAPLTPETAPATGPTTSDATETPKEPHPLYTEMESVWSRCRDLFQGTEAIHRHDAALKDKDATSDVVVSQFYLPKFGDETAASYLRRATRTELYNGFSRSVRAMAGLVLAKPPEVSAPLREMWEDLDGKGTHGDVLLRHALEDGLIVGRGGFLVDFPELAREDGRRPSRRDAQRAQARPYWLHFRSEDIISWRYAREGGRTRLVQLVLREVLEAPLGPFRTAYFTRYRVYRVEGRRVTWETWETEVGEPEGEPTPKRKGVILGQTDIPFAPYLLGTHTAPLMCVPPLLDLADANLAHYRISADRRWLMHLACVPILVRTGYQPPLPQPGQTQQQAQTKQGITLSPAKMQDVPIGGSIQWVEPSGTAFVPTAEELTNLLNYMAALGMAFLQSETRAAETAEAKRIDAHAQNATLMTAVRSLEDAVELAAEFHANYLRAEPGEVRFNRDYEYTAMEASMISVIGAEVAANRLSWDTYITLLERGSILPPGFDRNAERGLIVQQVREALQRQAAAAQVQQQGGEE